VSKGLKFAFVAATLLFSFACPHSAISWTFMSYEEATYMCSIGNLQACDVMYLYEMDRLRVPGEGSADSSASPHEHHGGGLRDIRHSPKGTYDFNR
jgi:hypothetical protein